MPPARLWSHAPVHNHFMQHPLPMRQTAPVVVVRQSLPRQSSAIFQPLAAPCLPAPLPAPLSAQPSLLQPVASKTSFDEEMLANPPTIWKSSSRGRSLMASRASQRRKSREALHEGRKELEQKMKAKGTKDMDLKISERLCEILEKKAKAGGAVSSGFVDRVEKKLWYAEQRREKSAAESRCAKIAAEESKQHTELLEEIYRADRVEGHEAWLSGVYQRPARKSAASGNVRPASTGRPRPASQKSKNIDEPVVVVRATSAVVARLTRRLDSRLKWAAERTTTK